MMNLVQQTANRKRLMTFFNNVLVYPIKHTFFSLPTDLKHVLSSDFFGYSFLAFLGV